MAIDVRELARGTGDELETVNFVRNLFSAARGQRAMRLEQWQRNYRMIHNRPWHSGAIVSDPSPTASEIFPIVAALVGWMTDQRPLLYVNPASDPGSPTYPMASELARDLEKVAEANWYNTAVDAEIEKMLWDGLSFGTGVLKTGWDASLEGGLGDGRISWVDLWRFYPDPAARSMDTANYFIEAQTMSIQEVDRRYPGWGGQLGSGEEILDERPELYESGRVPYANPGAISPAISPRYGPPGGDPGRTAAMRYDRGTTVYECWVRDHTVIHDIGEDEPPAVEDSWRVLVVAGNRLILHEQARELFGHGRHPYSRYVTTENGSFWGPSLVEHLIPNQRGLNRLLAAAQSSAELTGNPVFMEDTRAGISRTKIVNRPGQRLRKNPGAAAEWLVPPSMSNDVPNLMTFHLGELERISGLSAIVRGMTPEGRNAEGVLDAVQEAAFVRVRNALRNLERTLREAGQLLIHLIAENYTAPRIVAITGQENATPLVLSSNHFYMPDPTQGEEAPLRAHLWVQAGASLPTSRTARAAEADVLFALGAIDDEAVLEAHDYPNRAAIIQRINQKKAEGTFAPPGRRLRARSQ